MTPFDSVQRTLRKEFPDEAAIPALAQYASWRRDGFNHAQALGAVRQAYAGQTKKAVARRKADARRQNTIQSTGRRSPADVTANIGGPGKPVNATDYKPEFPLSGDYVKQYAATQRLRSRLTPSPFR